MSNKVCIESTVFTNPKTGFETKGIRVYDDYGSDYDNFAECIFDDDLEVLSYAVTSDCLYIVDTLQFVYDTQKGIEIDGTYYEWDEIKEILENRFGGDIVDKMGFFNKGDN